MGTYAGLGVRNDTTHLPFDIDCSTHAGCTRNPHTSSAKRVSKRNQEHLRACCCLWLSCLPPRVARVVHPPMLCRARSAAAPLRESNPYLLKENAELRERLSPYKNSCPKPHNVLCMNRRLTTAGLVCVPAFDHGQLASWFWPPRGGLFGY
jgi:hypothetical protein